MIALGANQGFPRQVRILKTDDFSSVFSLRKRIHGQFLVLHYAEKPAQNTHESLRFAVVAAKKVGKLAVSRNYMKRIMREQFRLHRTEIAAQMPQGLALDMIIRPQKLFSTKDFDLVCMEFADLTRRMLRRVNAVKLVGENIG